jgi:N-methylhydantoinase B/oxoprolinase/acetone carboxylase alpha subunit
MLSPILRTYFNPEESDKVLTMNYPHVMYYAPDVSNEDIGGGKLGGMDPFVIMPGHHGYMIQPIDLTERAAINKEYEEMLGRLCKIKEEWCLPKEKGQY